MINLAICLIELAPAKVEPATSYFLYSGNYQKLQTDGVYCLSECLYVQKVLTIAYQFIFTCEFINLMWLL